MDIRRRVQLGFTKPSRTQQNFRDECDINRIMAKYEKTGLLTHVKQFNGRYEDVSQVVSYQESLDNVRRAQEAFLSLPARIRGEFDNDPGKFLAFATDSANADRMVELGLARPRREAPPQKVEVVNSPSKDDPQGSSGEGEGQGAKGAKRSKA